MPQALLAVLLVVSVGGPAEDPAYLPVHAAAALGTFQAEGVTVTLRRAKHPAAAVEALRDGTAAVAVTTADQAVRGAWARGAPVRVLVAHTRAPATTLLVSAKHRDRVRRVEDLRGQRVGIPGPGTTGHLVLAALLARHRLGPIDLQLVSLGGAATIARLAGGELAAAALDEPWAARALEAGAGQALLDFRQPEETARQLGGPFYEVVSVARADQKAPAEADAALAGYVRALIRVQAWLAVTPAPAVAQRLGAILVGDADRVVARLDGARPAYVPDGQATDAGLKTTLEVLRAGSPWPVTLKVGPATLREPAFVTAARAALGPTPPPP
ncbi:MAG: ABC transporter substrate-binding protein [Candidatus Rokubacteria bacterium]|nr:ABC transporter substrate-binding protein [Candidatus Rokubacteria bacterium]